jgi:putative ABC transport system ATP-binding protein
MIVATGLNKIYRIGPMEIRAVDDLSLKIDKGEFISIVGPSGSGKTTLLHLLGCLDTPTSGTVSIDGIATNSLSKGQLTRLRREKIGFIFQQFNLLPVMSARENVELPLRYMKVPSKERRRRAMEALDRVGLGDRARNRPSQLSGGEQQRVAIARALVTEPVLVLADEPTGELDTYNTCRIIELMRNLNIASRQTFAIVTHDSTVASYTTRNITLRDGKVISDVEGEGRIPACEKEA